MAKLIFKNPTPEQLKHLYKAQEELGKAGVTFDTGSALRAGQPISREWCLDWSLEGAEIIEK